MRFRQFSYIHVEGASRALGEDDFGALGALAITRRLVHVAKFQLPEINCSLAEKI